MKKAYFLFGGIVIAGVIFLTSFKEGEMTAEQQEQFDKIETAVNTQLDAFRLEKDQECRDRAMQVALVQADSIMKAKPVKPGKKPTTTKKGDPTPVKPTTPSTNPKSDKMQGETNTQEKKDKIQGQSQEQNTEQKKSKIRGGGGGK